MREYAIELIPVKIYKKGLMFLTAKTVKVITNYLITKASKGVFITVNLFQCFPVFWNHEGFKKFASPINRQRKALQYCKLTDC